MYRVTIEFTTTEWIDAADELDIMDTISQIVGTLDPTFKQTEVPAP